MRRRATGLLKERQRKRCVCTCSAVKAGVPDILNEGDKLEFTLEDGPKIILQLI